VVDTATDDFVPLPSDNTFNTPTVDAPYGLKKDGTPAKRRGRQVGWRAGTSTSRVNRKGSLEKEIGGLLVMVNMPLQMVPALQRDALDHVEITALAKAIDQQCQTSPQFRKYVEQLLKVQGGTSLVAVVALIAGRRVIRHDILPIEIPEEIGGAAGVDLMLGQAIAASSNISIFKATNVEPSVTVEN
jgi:hypothetical protein